MKEVFSSRNTFPCQGPQCGKQLQWPNVAECRWRMCLIYRRKEIWERERPRLRKSKWPMAGASKDSLLPGQVMYGRLSAFCLNSTKGCSGEARIKGKRAVGRMLKSRTAWMVMLESCWGASDSQRTTTTSQKQALWSWATWRTPKGQTVTKAVVRDCTKACRVGKACFLPLHFHPKWLKS